MRDYEKIVYLNDYKNKKIAERIRKDPDSYEYCIIPNNSYSHAQSVSR